MRLAKTTLEKINEPTLKSTSVGSCDNSCCERSANDSFARSCILAKTGAEGVGMVQWEELLSWGVAMKSGGRCDRVEEENRDAISEMSAAGKSVQRYRCVRIQ